MNTPIYADLDQIIFEGRSQDYGAYQMRRRYNRILFRASLIAFLLFLSVTALPKMVNWIMPKVAEVIVVEDEPYIGIPDIPLPPKDPTDVIELPKPPAGPVVQTVAFAPINPTPDDQIRDEQIVAAIDDLDSVAIGLVNQDGAPGDYNWNDLPPGTCLDCPPADVVLDEPADDDPPSTGFILLEKEPQPVNLDELKHIIGYPPLAKEAGIEGRVTLRVMVDKYGNYAKHVVLKDPHPILTKAVTDKINLLKMTPGIQAGKPVKVWVTLPFNFELLN